MKDNIHLTVPANIAFLVKSLCNDWRIDLTKGLRPKLWEKVVSRFYRDPKKFGKVFPVDGRGNSRRISCVLAKYASTYLRMWIIPPNLINNFNDCEILPMHSSHFSPPLLPYYREMYRDLVGNHTNFMITFKVISRENNNFFVRVLFRFDQNGSMTVTLNITDGVAGKLIQNIPEQVVKPSVVSQYILLNSDELRLFFFYGQNVEITESQHSDYKKRTRLVCLNGMGKLRIDTVSFYKV